jgi:hypothetical protein
MQEQLPSVIRESCLIPPGVFASLTLRAALRAFNALRAFVGPAGLHPGYAGYVNDMCAEQFPRDELLTPEQVVACLFGRRSLSGIPAYSIMNSLL